MTKTIELQITPQPQLADVVKEAADCGEILLTDGGVVVARIVPVIPAAPQPEEPVQGRKRFKPMPLD